MPDFESAQQNPGELTQDPNALNRRGLEYHQKGRLEDAARCFQRAIQLAPAFAPAHNHLGNIYRLLGRLEAAVQSYRRAVRYQPANADLEINLGNALLAAGKSDEAIERFQYAVELDPKRAEAHGTLATLYQTAGKNQESHHALLRALKSAGRDSTLRVNMANLLQEMGQMSEAEAEYRKVLELDPDNFGAHSNLAYLLGDQSRMEESKLHYDAAIRQDPLPRLRIVAATKLPAINESAEQIQMCRDELSKTLDHLYEAGERIDPQREIMPTLFYLAYHGKNDRPLSEKLARLATSSNDPQIKASRPIGRRIRVGFLSMNLKQHTIGGLWTGLIEGMSRSDFDVCVLSANPSEDTVTRRIRSRADTYLVLPRDVPKAIQAAQDQKLDFLLFPDIGMDPFTYTLAFSRLAPVQTVTWGHPTTTGLKTVDYFLSGEDLETSSSEDFYTETLARFSRLMVCYDRPKKRSVRSCRSDFLLPPQAHVYGCPQTLFKFHPDFDEVIQQILERDSEAVLVMIDGRYEAWKRQLMERWRRKMGRLVERIHFAPRLSREEYLSLISVCDVLLDPLHFGGGNTSYEGFAMGVPIVTLPTPFLRARLTYAMYRQMGIDDFVVSNPQQYVSLALELGTNSDFRREASNKIIGSAECLFDDHRAIREFEEFIRASTTAAAESPDQRIVWRPQNALHFAEKRPGS